MVLIHNARLYLISFSTPRIRAITGISAHARDDSVTTTISPQSRTRRRSPIPAKPHPQTKRYTCLHDNSTRHRSVSYYRKSLNNRIFQVPFTTEAAADRSVLQYEFHQLLNELSHKVLDMGYEDLKKCREDLEDIIKRLVEKDIYLKGENGDVFLTTIQKLMSQCSFLGSVDGAELAEQYLTMVLKSNLKSSSTVVLSHHEKEDDKSDYMIVVPTKEMYTIVMDAWAKAQKSQSIRNSRDGLMPARRAKQILDFMWEEYRTRPSGQSVKPDVIHYTSLLQALANASSKKATQMALNLLKEVEKISGLNDFIQGKKNMTEMDPNLVPDRTIYNTVLYCLSRYFQSRDDAEGRSHSVQYVMGLMKEMMNKMELLAEKLNDDSWMPNTRTYNMLLMACSKKVHGGGKEAEKILEEMLQKIESKHFVEDATATTMTISLTGSESRLDLYENSVIPNVQSYNNVINAWSHDKSENAPERAESILKALLRRRNQHDLATEEQDSMINHPLVNSINPDVVTFNLVLNAWARSNQLQSGERAERMLNFMAGYSMQDKVTLIPRNEMKINLDDIGVEPDVISYNSTMNAWLKSGHESAANRAEELLNRLMNEYQNTGSIIPNDISFSTVMQAWSKSSDPNCGARAEILFDRLTELHRISGHETLIPSESCYTSLLAAYCNEAVIACKEESFQNAMNTLHRMQDEGGHTPKSSHNNMVLSVPSKISGNESIRFNVATKAKSLLIESQMDTGGDPGSSLDTYSFNHVIKAFQDYKDDFRRRESLFSALDTFNMLCEVDYCEPNDQTYIHLLKAIQSSLVDDSRDRVVLCEEIFRKCCESGLLTNAALKIIENLLPRQSIQRLEACRISSDPGPLTVYNLPPEWSENRRVGQNQRRNR